MSSTTLRLSGATKALALDAEYDQLNGGTVKIYDNGAAAPAGPDVAVPGGSVLLATLTLNATAFAAAVAGTDSATKTANAITSGTAAATGTALWARFFKSNGTTAVADADVGTSGAAINIATTSIVSGATVSISSCVITR